MQPLLIVALVCAATTAPSDCTRDTALDAIVQPAASSIPTECLAVGQAIVAGGALGRALDAGTYLKIGCERRKGE